jgi:hypothetical protein
VKRPVSLFLFLLLSLAGYSCQVSRFYAALQQLDASHTVNKNLTKKVVARTINSFNEEKKVQLLKERCRSIVGTGSIISPEILSLSATEVNFSPLLNSNYFFDILFSAGERGPPAVLIVS